MLAPEHYGFLAIPEIATDVLSCFTCGKPRLDDFLKETALALHKARLGFTNVVFHQDFEGPVGYFTLSNDSIPLNDSEKFDLGLEVDVTLSAFPAVKIGRLAVHKELQDHGVGAQVMDLVFGEIIDSGSLSAGRLVVVDADNDEKVLHFYKKLGFERSLWAEQQARNHGKKGRPVSTIKMHRDILKA